VAMESGVSFESHEEKDQVKLFGPIKKKGVKTKAGGIDC